MANEAVKIPDIKEILTTGLQFGHSTSRWNPKMSKYIFGVKNGIHIIDIVQSRQLLEKAAEFLRDAASRGEVVFVGTKRQAAEIVRNEAIRAGAHFVDGRWAGGVFTNFDVLHRSLSRLRDLEKMFDEGVEGRTKYEVSRMKVEWLRLNRLYGGIKNMDKLPAAMVVIDPNYEKVAVRESRRMHIPVIGLADTNCDPRVVDYIIPGNDDALGSISFVVKVLADSVIAGNEGKGIVHKFKDYSAEEIKIVKAVEPETSQESVPVEASAEETGPEKRKPVEPKAVRTSHRKGILEIAKERAKAIPKQSAKTKKPVVKAKKKAAPKKVMTKKVVSKKTAAPKKKKKSEKK